MSKTWFITGAGSGLGQAIAEAALARGDRVAATSRRVEDVAPLTVRFGDRVLPLALDVRDRAAAAPAVEAAGERFGGIDIVVNNAARALVAAIEEAGEAEVRDLIDTNLLGPLWVTQAALPVLRAQGRGHVIQISSGGGIISWLMNGIYQASKFGLEGMSEALAQEARHLGIRVTIAQVGHMESGFARYAAPARTLEAYAEPRAAISDGHPRKGNDPHALAPTFLKLVDMDEPPLRLLVGRSIDDIRAVYEERLRTWEDGAQTLGG